MSLFINSREREVGLNYSIDDGEADRMLPAKDDKVFTEISEVFLERILPGFSPDGEDIIREQFHNFCHTKEFDGTINDLFTLHEVNRLAHEKQKHVVWLGCPLPPSCNLIRYNHQVSKLQILKGIDCGSAKIFHMTEDRFKRFTTK